jgi:hypothetical protein
MQEIVERAEEQRQQKQSLPSRGRRSKLQQRARLELIGGIVFFILSQAGMRWFIDHQRPEWRDPSFEIKYRQFSRQLTPFNKKPAIVLFMGSSMTAAGMKPDMCEPPVSELLRRPVVAFNFSTLCGGPFTQLIYVQRLLRRSIRPDLVVIELSPLFLDFAKSPELLRFPGYLLERPDLETVSQYSDDCGLYEEWWQTQLIPIYGHRLTILNQIAKVLVPLPDRLDLLEDMDSHGWRRYEPAAAQAHARNLASIKRELSPRLAKHFIGQTPSKALHELLALLAREKIPTILVRMPEGPLLRSLYSPTSLAAVQNEFSDLSHQHQFPLVDSWDWFDEDHFIDSYHMTYVAGEKLTTRLVNEWIVPHFKKSSVDSGARSVR